jgi:hypothetical protein
MYPASRVYGKKTAPGIPPGAVQTIPPVRYNAASAIQ